MSEIDVRIVEALGRFSQAYRVLLRNKSQVNALSPIQAQILIFLNVQADAKYRVTALAEEFDLTKATVSDSVNALLRKCLVRKCVDPTDTRSYTIILTNTGKEAAIKSAAFVAALERPVSTLTAAQKEAIYGGLLKMIHELHQAGIIGVQRMCFTCRHYQPIGDGHYCKLIKSGLPPDGLKLDCPDHLKNF